MSADTTAKTNREPVPIPHFGTAPCKDCTDRKLACHDSCERFQAYRDSASKAKAQKAEFYMSHKMECCLRKKHNDIKSGYRRS